MSRREDIKNWLFEMYQLYGPDQIESLLQTVANDSQWFTLNDPGEGPASQTFSDQEGAIYRFQPVGENPEKVKVGPASLEDIYIEGGRAYVLGTATGMGRHTGRALSTMFVDVVWIKEDGGECQITKYKRYIDTLKDYRAEAG